MKQIALAIADFCNRNVREFVPQTPRFREKYENLKKIHTTCIQLLFQYASESQLKEAFPKDFDYRVAYHYFEILAGKRSFRALNLKRIANFLEDNVKTFLSVAPQILNQDPGRDLMKMEQVANILNHHSEPEKAYALLIGIFRALPKDCQEILENSSGYKQIVEWGATHFLKDFWISLQREYGITHTAIKGQAAQNLAQGLDQIETQSKQQKESYEDRINELEKKLALSYTKSALELARKLQDRPSPMLQQIYSLYTSLEKLSQQGTLPKESMSILIVLEELLQALEEIGITRYPSQETFILTKEQLSSYNYIKGSPFFSEFDEKRVRCIRQGWKACGEIISAAVIEEIVEEKKQ